MAFHSRFVQPLIAGLVTIELLYAAPGFAHPAQTQQLDDRSTSLSSRLQQSESAVAQAQDIIDTAAATGSFQTLLQLLDELGMTEDLRGYGRFTVFAPTDDAFAAIPPEIMEKLADDRELMSRVLAYHVVSSNRPLVSDQISTPASVRTLERSEVRISRRRGRLYVNTARVTNADIPASNGVIHVIDQVLIPQDILSQIRG